MLNCRKYGELSSCGSTPSPTAAASATATAMSKTATSPARRAAAARWRRGIAAPSGPWQRNRGFRLHTEFSLVGWTRVGVLGSPIKFGTLASKTLGVLGSPIKFGTLASKTLGVLWLGLSAVPEVFWPV